MSQPKGDLYTFTFAAAVCIACALVLANAATLLKPRQEANARLDVMVNILGAVGHAVPDLKAKSPQQVFDLYKKEFEELLLDGKNQESQRGFMEQELITHLGYPEADIKGLDTGALLARFNSKVSLLAKRAGKDLDSYDPNYKVIYLHKPAGTVDAYVIPIKGYGLWDIIKGYVALDPSLNTIMGITFYEHKETPGLGARITEDWFKQSFKGKKILDENGKLVSIQVAKGIGKGDHQVDGISGATLTGNGINHFLKTDLVRYEPYFQTLRGN